MALPPDLPCTQETAPIAASAFGPQAPGNGGAEASALGLSWPVAGPWKRLFARTIDSWLVGLPVMFLTAFALSFHSRAIALWLQEPGTPYLFAWFCYPLFMIAEGIVYAPRRITPGKALLGLEVLNIHGTRATPNEYFKRQWGVWWYGLATGAPLISLFCMGRQYGHLKSGERPTYDKGQFIVRAKPIGFLRYLLAAVCIFGLLAINGALSQLGNELSSAQTGPSGHGSTDPQLQQWTNPGTGKSLALPTGWTVNQTQNDQQQDVFVFSKNGVSIVLGSEAFSGDVSIDDYGAAWRAAVSESMSFGTPTDLTVHGVRALGLTGYLVADQSQRVRATLFRSGGRFWRMVVVGGDWDTQQDDVVRFWKDVAATAV